MAAPGGKYFLGEKMKAKAAHHESFQQLWETKWQFPRTLGVYPFMFGAAKDFECVASVLLQLGIKEPYNWDEWAGPFLAQGDLLAGYALQAEILNEKQKASELYLRASAVYRIGRFPYPRSKLQKTAWEKGKETCLRGLSFRDPPTTEVRIPHKQGLPHEGSHLPIYYTRPSKASREIPVPLVVIVTGLDGYRTELAVWAQGWADLDCATAMVEIPGTGDSPADPSDPTSPDRQFSTLLDWIGQQEDIDQKRIVSWAFSTGAYYAIRMAHTHAQYFAGVVAQGGGCHHMFDPEWLDAAQHLEYPFDLSTVLSHKFGYEDNYDLFKREASDKFSLLKDGTLDKPGCARLLLVNGTDDGIFPIDDYYLCLQHGDPKEARFIPNTPHMGEPDSFVIILSWLYKILGIQSHPGLQLSKLPFVARY